MVDAAIEPTRRHYRAQILGIFTSGGVSAVAAARTAFDALQGLLEVEIYRNAIVADARFHAVTLVAGPGEPSHDDAVKKVKEFREGDACKASTGPPVVDERVSARETAAKMPLVWWTYLPADMRAKICKNERVPDAAWKLILQATRVHGIDRTKIPVPDAKGWQPANDLIKMACERLTRLADLPENRNPCAPIASLKAGWQPPKVAPGS
jgi:hypothetical protein